MTVRQLLTDRELRGRLNAIGTANPELTDLLETLNRAAVPADDLSDSTPEKVALRAQYEWGFRRCITVLQKLLLEPIPTQKEPTEDPLVPWGRLEPEEGPKV